MTRKILLPFLLFLAFSVYGHDSGLTKTDKSKYAIMTGPSLGSVHWTDGFWGERFEIFKDTMILSMWNTLNDTTVSHSFQNFEVAAGVRPGRHHGPPFHDGDFYKWFEGVAAIYAQTHDPKLEKLMDHIIDVIAKCQRSDGYLHTPVIIKELIKKANEEKDNIIIGTATGTRNDKAFENRLNFETYNLGHLMMAGIIHYRATGKRTLLDPAIKATDFLCHFYETASAELARNAICPSHYMGVVEMYRTTHNPKYLELAGNLINIRGMVENGTDDNQDRVPFRQQTTAMGHAVRANYLYAGVADVFAETGETKLYENLESIWNDIVERKMYITGACGALYDGTSPDGTEYKPDLIQKVHQSYGRAYQLPNATAHNETCANIGNMLFNWRMFNVSGDAKYIDVLETALYNSVMSSISLDGTKYFYTNPMRMSEDFPYTLRWPKERTKYISCFCCPPNTVRTLAEVGSYAYSINQNSVWVNLYGGNDLDTELEKGHQIRLSQISAYPWDGKVLIRVDQNQGNKAFAIKLRIPGWSKDYTLKLNGKELSSDADKGYVNLEREWKKNDQIELELNMKARLMESNPLVEETRNQTAIQRGPIVYCLEGLDLSGNARIDDIIIPAGIDLKAKSEKVDGYPITVLEGDAELNKQGSWKGNLYREVNDSKEKIRIRLIPYYAWGNREKCDMTVWLPLSK